MRLGFQARCLEVIPETFAAPMVVELWAQLLVVADMRTGQHVTTCSAKYGLSYFAGK